MECDTFLEHLRDARLLPDHKLDEIQAHLAAGIPVGSVTMTLVDQGLLTPYQARKVHAGEGRGLSLGQYRLLEEIGRGGMGHVYKAVHTIMGRTVAVKVISAQLVKDEQALRWFNREVRATTQLCHPNIVMAYDANEADGLHFLVMEYVDGVNLDAHVRKQGPLAPGYAAELMRQAALGLQHAHDKGMVHRDVKPANLLLPRESQAPRPEGTSSALALTPLVKIVDFGLARLHASRGGETIMANGGSGFFGTPDYIAPEQSCDIHAADIRSDLYSLGCSFYYALSGRLPFPGAGPMEKLVGHLSGTATPLEQLRPDVPSGLATILRRLMEKEPERRFQTPAELAEELSRCLLGGAIPAVGGPAAAPRGTAAAADVHTLFRPDLAAGPAVLPLPAGTLTPSERRGLPPPSEANGTAWLPALAEEAAAEAPAETFSPLVPESKTEVGLGPAAEAVPEPPAPPPAELRRVEAELRKAWRQWSDVVGAFAREGCYTGSDEEYRALHRGILDACRYAAAAAPAGRRELFARLEAIARPWLSLTIFQRTDHEVLGAVFARCREAQQELGADHGPGWRAGLWAAVALACLVPPALVVLFGKAPRVPRAAWNWNGGWQAHFAQLSDRCWAYLEGNPTLWVAGVFPVVLVVSALLLIRKPPG